MAKSSDTAAVGKARSPHVSKGRSPHTAAAAGTSSDTAVAGIDIPASETPYAIKDAVLRELIGLGKVEIVTRSSKLSRSGK